jgi:hypothetical protein
MMLTLSKSEFARRGNTKTMTDTIPKLQDLRA